MKALKYINPLLDKADKEEKEAGIIAAENEKILMQLKEELMEFHEMYMSLTQNMTELDDFIVGMEKELLIEDDEVDSEQERLDYEIGRIKEQITNLQSQVDLIPNVDEDELHIMEMKREDEQAAARLKKQAEEIMIEIKNDENEVEILKNRLVSENKEKQLVQKEECELHIEQYMREIAAWEEKCDGLCDELKELEGNIIAEEDKMSSLSILQANIVSEWKQFDIGGIPDKEAVQTEFDKLKEKELQIEEDFHTFYDLQKDLPVWKLSREREDIEMKLKKKRKVKV